MSVPPPGAAGTIKRMVFVGYCAAAGDMEKGAARSVRQKTAIRLVIRFPSAVFSV
jgi:hypothetical protein